MLLPRQRSKLARGAKDEEHDISQNLNRAIFVIGIDIGKNSFHILAVLDRGHRERAVDAIPAMILTIRDRGRRGLRRDRSGAVL